MREILQRLFNHTLCLISWLIMGGITFGVVLLLVFSNVANFSDAWNEVHPSLPLINDTLFLAIITILRSFENALSLPHDLTRLLSSFDYAHGYAIVQATVTFLVETIMAWSMFRLFETRHAIRNIEQEVALRSFTREQGTRALHNSRTERRRYLITFIIFLFLSIIIWGYDFSLTMGRTVHLLEPGQKLTWISYLGPIGPLVLLTLVSTVFAFIVERVQQLITMIIRLIGDLSGPQELPAPAGGGRIAAHEREELTSGSSTGETRHPELPSDNNPEDRLLMLYTLDGIEHRLRRDINSDWRAGHLSIDGRIDFDEDYLIYVDTLYQVLDADSPMFYTSDGINNLRPGSYRMDENHCIHIN